ncbi:universal stress protein [Saccharopolyspora sp. NFXS83]|uniref:universal stress protein n=1 Tax=Saccharopolyspora sp. NFXS83 TaxID=2993560 RepID=UPI003A4DAECE
MGGGGGARSARIRLICCDTQSALVVPEIPGVVLPQSFFDAVREQGEGWLCQARDTAAAEAPSVPIETEFVPRSAPTAVLVAESRTASLIAVGSRGLGGFTRLLVGSVAVSVSAHASPGETHPRTLGHRGTAPPGARRRLQRRPPPRPHRQRTPEPRRPPQRRHHPAPPKRSYPHPTRTPRRQPQARTTPAPTPRNHLHRDRSTLHAPWGEHRAATSQTGFHHQPSRRIDGLPITHHQDPTTPNTPRITSTRESRVSNTTKLQPPFRSVRGRCGSPFTGRSSGR